MISFLVAMDRERGIGIRNQLPWRLPADLKHFRDTTMGHAILMGRKTFESIGKPLPGRRNVVLTRNTDYQPEGVTVVHSAEEAFQLFGKEGPGDSDILYVIGGAEVFNQLMAGADQLVVTHIDEVFEADTYFPEISPEEWEVVSRRPGITDEKNPYRYEFVTYERKRTDPR